MTGLPISNASLLDEAQAAGECLYLALNYHDFKRTKFFISSNTFPQVRQTLKTKARYLNIEIIVDDPLNLSPEIMNSLAGAYF